MKDLVSLPLDRAESGVTSKYLACVLAAQRALQLNKGNPARVEVPYYKPTTQALAELQAGKIDFAMGNDALESRSRDEALYKEVLTETRLSYVDEEGQALFAPHPPAPERASASAAPAKDDAPADKPSS